MIYYSKKAPQRQASTKESTFSAPFDLMKGVLIVLLIVIISVATDLGTIAFAISGINLSKMYKPNDKFLPPFIAFLFSFGGGLTRDLIFLRCRPAILSAQESICVLLLTLLAYYAIGDGKVLPDDLNHIVKKVITAFDAIGIAVFIPAGVDAAFNQGASTCLQLLCGLVTAMGGGVLGSLLAGMTIKQVMLKAPLYRLIVVFHTLFYLQNQKHTERTALLLYLLASCFVTLLLEDQLVTSSDTATPIRHIKLGSPNRVAFALTFARRFWLIVNPHKGQIKRRIVLTTSRSRGSGIAPPISY